MKGIVRRVIFAVWTVACCLFFQLAFKYHFLFIEQNQLFLCSEDFVAEFFSRPAWLSFLSASFIHQFYHYQYCGAVILSLLLLLTGISICQALNIIFRTKWKRAGEWIATAVAIFLITFEAGFYLYENASLAPLFSFIGGALCWLACRKVPYRTKAVYHIVFIVVCALCFWTFGFGALVMVTLEIMAAVLEKRIPVGAAAVVIIGISFSGGIAKHYGKTVRETVLCPSIGKRLDYKVARKVEKLLAFNYEYGQGNYVQVIKWYEKAPKSCTRDMMLLYSLSLSQMGLLPDRLPYLKDVVLGTTDNLSKETSLFYIELLGEYHFLTGEMTYAERIALHSNSFSQYKRSSRQIRRLAEINLVTGDENAAEKYLRMLRKSIVYRGWANERSAGRRSEEVERWIAAKRALINKGEGLYCNDNYRALLTGLLDSNPKNVAALDYLLCTEILLGQKNEFIDDYGKYGPRDKALYNEIMRRMTPR